MIFEVNDPANVGWCPGSVDLMFRDTVGGASLRILGDIRRGMEGPAAAQKMVNQDLRGYSAGADFIIPTSSEFRSAAERVKAFRRRRRRRSEDGCR
jgi:hypothetical protein